MPKVYAMGINGSISISHSVCQVDYIAPSYQPTDLIAYGLQVEVLRGSINVFCEIYRDGSFTTVISLNVSQSKTDIKIGAQANYSNLCGIKTLDPESSLFSIKFYSLDTPQQANNYFVIIFACLLIGIILFLLAIIYSLKKSCKKKQAILNEKDIIEMKYGDICKMLDSLQMEDRKVKH